MSTDANEAETKTLSPDDAFAVLGNETRMEILQTLGEADGPLSFSELRERVGMRDSGQFNYHLGKVEGHFVSKADDEYELRQAGRRIIEAVLSGAVTDDPVMEPTRIDEPCPICDAPAMVAFYQGRIEHYCTECAGYYGRAPPTGESATASDESATSSDGSATTSDESATSTDESDETAEYGYLGSFQLPPAGIQGRTPDEVFRAACTWGLLRLVAVASGVCPSCSAPLADSVVVCEAHDSADGHCDRCDNRHAIQLDFRCTNCLYGGEAAFPVALVANTDLLAFLTAHGINPVSPSSPAAYSAALMDYEEELLSVDPFEARFTFTLDGDALTLTVDDDLNVVEIS